jgi:DNA (cytosine-5)-methyltransferase 1
MNSMELFAGVGGLAMGTAMAGFEHQALVERDRRCCDTMRENQRQGVEIISGGAVYEMDVADFDFGLFSEKIDFLSGGPPCQPFSIGGRHGANLDRRDMFPQFFRAVRELRPKAFLIENVRGLMRSSFANYFAYIVLQLAYPDILPKPEENWREHLARLEQHHNHNSESGLHYRITFRLLNAADYGIPQKRERVFIVGFRADLQSSWSFPEPTHSEAALNYQKWVTGEYWQKHQISLAEQPPISPKFQRQLQRQGMNLFTSIMQPWQTVRDAISDLLAEKLPEGEKRSDRLYNPGAKTYPGHTGSPLDEPAKTLKAGVHGVPGGENMLAWPDGNVRYLTIREAARLQGFPDNYCFPNPWGESMRQIGNAVPVTLAHLLSESIYQQLQAI